MLKQLRFGLLALMTLATVLPLAAQVRHVTTVNPQSKRSYMEVYAYKKRIQGRVLCSFIVGTDGKVSDVRVIRGAADESLNREAIRVIAAMPKWSVGKVGKHAVPVRVVLPINFRL